MNKFVGIIFIVTVFSFLTPLSDAAQPDIWEECTENNDQPGETGYSHRIGETTYYCCFDGANRQWQTSACDTTDPTVEYITTEGQRFKTAPTSLDINFRDNIQVDDIYYQFDGRVGSWQIIATNVFSVSYTTDWDVDTTVWNTLSEGTHYIYFKVTDYYSREYVTPDVNTAFEIIKDVTGPSCSVSSITESSSYAHVSGTTVHYSTRESGSFEVTVSADDPAGVQKVNFPSSIFAFNDGGDVLAPGPYSKRYNWGNGNSYDGSATVTCHDTLTNTNTGTFTVDRDVASPTGVSIDYTAGYYTTTSVPISLSTGTDQGTDPGTASGVDTASDYIERQDAALSGDSCVSWGLWSTIKTNPGASWTDDGTDGDRDTTGPVSGKCYKYRYTVKDNVNNGATHVSSNEAKVDNSGPSVGQATIYAGTRYTDGTNYWYRGNIGVRATASDGESGISSCLYSIDNGNTWSFAAHDGTYCKKENLSPGTDITINLRATNNARLQTTGTGRSYAYDNTAPTTSASATSLPGGASYTFGTKTKDNVQVTLSCTDNAGGSGCPTTVYCTDDRNTCSPSDTGTPVTISDPGTRYVRYYSGDNLQNVETTQSRTVVIDRTAPVISITRVGDDSESPYMTTITTPEIVLGTDESANCKYSTTANTPYDSMLNQFSPTPPFTGISHSTILLELLPGTYDRYARCKDVVDNKNTVDKTITFNICGRSNPTVAITPSPQEGEPGDLRDYTVQVTNNDVNCGNEIFDLTKNCPAGWRCTFASESLTIASRSFQSTTLSITSSQSAAPASYDIPVVATNRADTNLKDDTQKATYVVLCVNRLAVKEMPPEDNFNTETKRGEVNDIKHVWTINLRDSSSAGCPDPEYTITNPTDTSKLFSTSGSCHPQTGLYKSRNPPSGLRLSQSQPYKLTIPVQTDVNDAFKVFVQRSGTGSCTLSFVASVGDKVIDPTFTVRAVGAPASDPHVSFFDFSGDASALDVKWEAFYPDEPFRTMEVKCGLRCDPRVSDCSDAQVWPGRGCTPYPVQHPADEEIKKGGCGILSPAYDFTQANDNNIQCLFYDPNPNNPNLQTYVRKDFTPVDFAIQTADKIATTVGTPFDLKIDVANKGILEDSYTIALSGPATVDISPTNTRTSTIGPSQLVSTFSAIMPLVDEASTIRVTVTSVTSGKTISKDIELNPGFYALPEFGLAGFLQIILIATAVYFLLTNKNLRTKKRRRR